MAELKALLENRKEHVQYLQDVLLEPVLEEFSDIYQTVTTKSKVLQEFQTELGKIPEWNHVMIGASYERIKKRSGCKFLSELIRAIFTTSVKCHLMTHGKLEALDKIRFRVPTTEKFIHRLLIACAQHIWKQPYLFYHAVRSIERQYNRGKVEEIIRKQVETTIRQCLPLEQLVGIIQESVEEESESESESDSSVEKESEESTEVSSSESEESEEEYASDVEIERIVVESEASSESESEIEARDESEENESEARDESEENESEARDESEENESEAERGDDNAVEGEGEDEDESERGIEVEPGNEAESAQNEAKIEPGYEPDDEENFIDSDVVMDVQSEPGDNNDLLAVHHFDELVKALENEPDVIVSDASPQRKSIEINTSSDEEEPKEEQEEEGYKNVRVGGEERKIIPLKNMLINQRKFHRPKMAARKRSDDRVTDAFY